MGGGDGQNGGVCGGGTAFQLGHEDVTGMKGPTQGEQWTVFCAVWGQAAATSGAAPHGAAEPPCGTSD